MRATCEVEPIFDEHAALLRGATGEICKLVNPVEDAELIRAGKNLAEIAASEEFYVLREGSLICSIKGRVIAILEEGDPIGIDAQLCHPEVEVNAEFAVRVERYSMREIMRLAHTNPMILWHLAQINSTYAKALGCIVLALSSRGDSVQPEAQAIDQGEVLIKQGDIGEYVYTLIEGHLAVLVDNVQVGEILPDEIFGALAALSNSTRSATVQATRRSLVLKLHRDDFVELIKTRPHTVREMFVNMARALSSLNNRFVELERGRRE